MKLRSGGFSGSGVTSMIIVFTALVLVVFSLLSLQTVRQDMNVAEKVSQTRTKYYAADVAATEKLAALYGITQNYELSAFTAKAADLGISTEIKGRGENAEVTFSWKQKISEDSTLCCTAVFSQGELTISDWSTVSSHYYINDDALPIWDGNSIF